MVGGSKVCPECGTQLQLGRRRGLTIYPCSQGHGVGINLLDAYGHFQEDELEAIWEGCRTAPLSSLPSPITGHPMAEVTFTADDDLQHGNEGRNARDITIEVDVENRFGWFSVEELEDMPVHYETSSGIVGIEALGSGDKRQNDFFSSLTDADFEDDLAYSDRSSTGAGGLFSSVMRRLRS